MLGAITSEDIDLDQSHDCGAVLPAASVSILANKACRRIGHAGVRLLLHGGPWISRCDPHLDLPASRELVHRKGIDSVVRNRNRHSGTAIASSPTRRPLISAMRSSRPWVRKRCG